MENAKNMTAEECRAQEIARMRENGQTWASIRWMKCEAYRALGITATREQFVRAAAAARRIEIEVCPGCNEPAHPHESDDDGYHEGCRPEAR